MPIAEDGGTISDPVLLMEVMEQRELVEETTDVGLLQGMLEENKLLEQATTQVTAGAYGVCNCGLDCIFNAARVKPASCWLIIKPSAALLERLMLC